MTTDGITYEIVRSDRKTIALVLRPGGEVIVRAPRRTPLSVIEQYVRKNKDLIPLYQKRMEERRRDLLENYGEPYTDDQLREFARQARKDLPPRVRKYAARIGVTYGKISIRCMRSQWGSCSANGNLSFNCLLMAAPEKARDYVVVHELCHRKQMNHSAGFWAEVEKYMPDYREPRKWLRDNGSALIARMILRRP